MKLPIILVAVFVLVAANMPAQSPAGSGYTPKEIVEQLWIRATEGELLKNDGWRRTSGFYLHPVLHPERKAFAVMSNYYGVVGNSIKGDNAEIDVECANLGTIDSKLHYNPPAQKNVPSFEVKEATRYRLIYTQTHGVTYQWNGKSLLNPKETPGPMEWKIENSPGLPFTTVNTAIRYVLEVQKQTRDPKIKKNADQTISILLKFH